ncbi:hypothetical protein [Aeromicrobium terrae]|uniref:Uncharacterized protein n=1 Tax=Aeromicrobium terrae TaxID=2498846 RepID=A0A5C8NH25_9ACTN|nr:hypothetical protein [Aeromicrobium terrae]TXL57878.1 hypothetical protein FHP06_11070 [Aeromicrobium terrae]
MVMPDDPEVLEIQAVMRAAGWSGSTSILRELHTWLRLGHELASYEATIDDYTNDLCSRDYLETVLGLAKDELRREVEAQVAAGDAAFRQATEADDGQRLANFYRLDSNDGWWWRRRPKYGPLAAYLVDATLPQEISDLCEAVESEQLVELAARATGASDESLAAVSALLRSAADAAASGNRTAAVAALESAARVVVDEWKLTAPLGATLCELAQSARS